MIHPPTVAKEKRRAFTFTRNILFLFWNIQKRFNDVVLLCFLLVSLKLPATCRGTRIWSKSFTGDDSIDSLSWWLAIFFSGKHHSVIQCGLLPICTHSTLCNMSAARKSVGSRMRPTEASYVWPVSDLYWECMRCIKPYMSYFRTSQALFSIFIIYSLPVLSPDKHYLMKCNRECVLFNMKLIKTEKKYLTYELKCLFSVKKNCTKSNSEWVLWIPIILLYFLHFYAMLYWVWS